MRRSGEFVTGPWRYERFDDAGHWVSLEVELDLQRHLVLARLPLNAAPADATLAVPATVTAAAGQSSHHRSHHP